MSRPGWLSAGLFLTTLATLPVEILDSRLLSVLTWYHLSFFAVSLPMLGMAAGAVFVFLRGDRFALPPTPWLLARISLYFALAVPISHIFNLVIPLPSLGQASAIAVVARRNRRDGERVEGDDQRLDPRGRRAVDPRGTPWSRERGQRAFRSTSHRSWSLWLMATRTAAARVRCSLRSTLGSVAFRQSVIWCRATLPALSHMTTGARARPSPGFPSP